MIGIIKPIKHIFVETYQLSSPIQLQLGLLDQVHTFIKYITMTININTIAVHELRTHIRMHAHSSCDIVRAEVEASYAYIHDDTYLIIGEYNTKVEPSLCAHM